MNAGIVWALIGMALALLMALAVLYNWFVGWWGELKEGFVAFLVVGGVIVTSAMGAVIDWALHQIGIDWNVILINAMVFTASGLPMIVGDVARHQRVRRDNIRRQRAEALAEADEVITDDYPA